jgi:O-succinylbenzoate synthase
MQLADPDPVPVDAIELIRVQVPYRRPWRAAHGEETHRDSSVVRWIRADGVEGWGECVSLSRPTYTNEYADGSWRVLCHELAPAALAGRRSDVVGHPLATSALECASLDARLRADRCSLARAVGAVRERLPVMAVVGLGSSIHDVMTEVEQLVGDGYRAVSLKVRPEFDIEPIRAVRHSFPDLLVAADANGSYTVDDVDRLDALDKEGLAWIEQPFPAAELVATARLAERLGTPVSLDESIDSAGAFEAAVEIGSLALANVKPARFGAITELLRVHSVAVERDIPLYCGGMMECGIGRAFALSLAGLAGFTQPTHLGPSQRYFDDDITDPVELDSAGTMAVPSGPGIGVTPHRDRLRAVAVDRMLLRA